MDISQDLKDIAKHYGYDVQSNQLIEECAELIQAVSKYRRALSGAENRGVVFSGAVAFENLIEEIADVEVMLEQIKYLLQIPEKDLLAMKLYKVYRTKDRIASKGAY